VRGGRRARSVVGVRVVGSSAIGVAVREQPRRTEARSGSIDQVVRAPCRC